MNILLASVLFFTASSPSTAWATNGRPQQIEQSAQSIPEVVREKIAERCFAYLSKLHAERDFPGASAALILPDGSQIDLPIGYSDLESETAMTSDALLLSGSIGKTYVSAAAHLLMVQGKLDFDQHAFEFFKDSDWFERIPNWDQFTVRQLLRHESGIARHVFKPNFLPDCYAAPDKEWTPKELLSYVFDDEPMFPAGEGWAYADTNFIVLGMIIEKVSGQDFYEFVQASFLTPLQLKQTSPSDSRRIPGLIQGYIKAFKTDDSPDRSLKDGLFFFNPQFEWCGGGYASSSMDLARWARALYSGKAIDGEYLSAMLDGVPARLGPRKQYGLGVMLTTSELGPIAGHDGIMMGYHATVGHLLESNITFCLMMNTDDMRALSQPLDLVSERLAAIALEELAKKS